PRPAPPLAPATSMASAPDVAQRSIPVADTLDSAIDGMTDAALDSERILELPSQRARATAPLAPAVSAMVPRRATTPAQQRRMSGGMSAGSSGMLSLAEATQGYARALRPMRATSEPARNSANAAATSGRATPAQQRHDGDGDGDGACPHCHGAGYVRLDVPVGDPSFGQAVACVCKEQQMEDRRMSDLRRMSSLDAFRDKTFTTFDTSLPGVREALEVAQRYAEDPQGWLVLSGGYGVGKTHLAAAIAHERLASGQSVFFSIVPDLLDHLRAAFAPSSEMPYDELFDKVREAGVLVLDDLGAENATAWATEKLFQIINYRYNYHMPTVVTTNHRLLAHMDERIRSRLSDRSFVRNVAIDSTDYRERRAGRARPTSQSGASGTTGATRGTRNAYQR
ncbi:MAG: ATP-binding protein, partial [Ktedonobacterales bacterium]